MPWLSLLHRLRISPDGLPPLRPIRRISDHLLDGPLLLLLAMPRNGLGRMQAGLVAGWFAHPSSFLMVSAASRA